MLLFMGNSLCILLKLLMGRFIKNEFMVEVIFVLKIFNMKFIDKEQQVDYYKVDVGFVV